jgi:His-Xaa-Ser system radical SAM maturase HxsB
MKIWPLKFHKMTNERLLFSDDAGGFFVSSDSFLHRYASNLIREDDKSFLLENGHAFYTEYDLSYTSFSYRWTARQAAQKELNYLILVPTLRCNLTCSYCQVSRAPEQAEGFDWSENTLNAALAFIAELPTREIKIEFQGGEPLLRLDLLERVRAFCRERFERAEFVICTNLQRVDAPAWRFLESPDTFVSTSLDGDPATHERQRTQTPNATRQFFTNLDEAVSRLGPGKVSALPTIDIARPPDMDALIANFEERGISSIHLRPVNYQGFARRGRDPDAFLDRWNAWHGEFIEHLIARNYKTNIILEEYYFSQCLRRVLQPNADNHADLRNPSLFASDYIVIDHDGQIYPTDEARMQSRIGRIDLSIGNIRDGIDREKVSTLNYTCLNNFDPDCIHCAFQPFCGSDVVDNISRYGRVDVATHETWFCRRHMSLFDKVFELLYRDDEATRFSLSRWMGIPEWTERIARVHR